MLKSDYSERKVQMPEFIRSEILIGKEALEKLKSSSVAVFGVGGVGSYVCEALARCAVGNLTLIDNDTVAVSNINRQLIALHSTIGKQKAEVMAERVKDINPNVNVKAVNMFYTPQNNEQIDISKFDYVVDAIDTVTSKLDIIERCIKNNVKIISSMGTGNKLNPSLFSISDISKTHTCPLARVMRKELKERGIHNLKVLWSPETAILPTPSDEDSKKRQTPASISFVPSVAGLLIAGEVIKDLINDERNI